MSFGENLINLRKQKGWSQDDLADNLNLSRQAISKWENETSKPDIDNIKKISKIFSVKIDDLLNNDVVKDKAVTLNVKKQEKKEKTITIVKCMIIAVIILYIINVIFKFASLLIIVNGIQKYANLSNYHYVITTYEDNQKKEVKECWYKDGIIKIISNSYNGDVVRTITTAINYNEKLGYIIDSNNNKENLNLDEYQKINADFWNSSNLYFEIPLELRESSPLILFLKCLYSTNIKYNDAIMYISNNVFIEISNETMLPNFTYTYDSDKNKNITKIFSIDVNYNKDLII